MAAAKLSEPQQQLASGEQPAESTEVPTRGAPADAPANPPQVIAGRYRLDKLLGRGGMGEVWGGEHLVTRRSVAVKVLRNALVHQPDMRRRFLREARAAAAVHHPNVVEVLDAFELDDGTPALVMPLLQGETLGAALARQGMLDVTTALTVLLPLVAAVAAAHESNIVHRDLKPDNVFLAIEDGRQVVKVLDFGIAKLVAEDPATESAITGTGTLIGTPCYMAPEQAFGERDQDHRVDMWAIGVIAYEMLGGCRPIEGENIGQVVKALLTQATTPLAIVAPHAPQALSALVMWLLSRDKTQRPQTLAEVHHALRELLANLAPPSLQQSGATLISQGSDRPLERPRTPASFASPTPAEHTISQSKTEPTKRAPLLIAGTLALVGGAFALVHAKSDTGEHPDVSSAARALSASATPVSQVVVTPALPDGASNSAPEVASAASASHAAAPAASASHAAVLAVTARSAPAVATQRSPGRAASATPAAAPALAVPSTAHPAPTKPKGLQEEPPF
jgi:eukaryotic-like serine/threonine-protein kinase